MKLFLLISLIFSGLSLFYATLSLAPPLSSRKKDRQRVNELSRLKPNELFYDLGSGWGQITRYLAKQNPQSRILGIELCLPVFLFSLISRILAGPENLRYKMADIYLTDLSRADVIYVFASHQEKLRRLSKRLKESAKPGCRIISYAFPLHGWEAAETSKPSNRDLSIYVYKKL